MKQIPRVAALLTFVITHALLAQDTDFQTGKIVAVEKVASASHPTGTDAPLSENRHVVNVTIQVNDQLYVCRAETAGYDLGWSQGKELPVKVQGRKMAVKKARDEIVELPILSTKKAD